MSESDPNASKSSEGTSLSIIQGISEHLVPRALKALDRLVGGIVDIPAAWLDQQADKIRSKTKSYSTVEAEIAKKAGDLAAADTEIANRAMNNLVRKEYRRTENREKIAAETLKTLKEQAAEPISPEAEAMQIDEDWLNVFERFAEDASTERMQNLWSRVLAGEIEKPGKFSLRTLRFLSEFSQEEAQIFSDFSKFVFGGRAPREHVLQMAGGDVSDLVKIETSGLISGASGLGFSMNLTFDQTGRATMSEIPYHLALFGEPNEKIGISIILVTSLGIELLELIKDRNIQSSILNFSHAINSETIKSAYYGKALPGDKILNFSEKIW
jgi:Protein of unknown function (DUF2806)